MVDTFTLEREDANDKTVKYTADNLVNIVMDFASPLVPMPLPQEPDDENVLVKVEGNQTTVNITWRVRQALGEFTVVNDANVAHEAAGGNSSSPRALTPLETIDFFRTQFVPVTVDHAFTLKLGDGGTDFLQLSGTLQKMTFTISGNTPTVWDGNLQFVVGNVVAKSDADLAGQPSYDSISNSSSSTAIQIDGIETNYWGTDDTITGYKFKYKLTTASAYTTVTVNTTNTDDFDHTLTVPANGTYKVKFSAITATHPENVYTNTYEVVVS